MGTLGAVELLGFGLLVGWLVSGGFSRSGERKPGRVSRKAQTYIGLALLNGGIAVRVRNLGFLAKTGSDAAVDEAEDRDGAEGDGNDGPVDATQAG